MIKMKDDIVMGGETLVELIENTKSILENCNKLDAELTVMNEHKRFLIDEYKTNKKYFRIEPGKTTIEDVIKTCFEYGWTAHSQFEYDQNRKKNEVPTS